MVIIEPFFPLALLRMRTIVLCCQISYRQAGLFKRIETKYTAKSDPQAHQLHHRSPRATSGQRLPDCREQMDSVSMLAKVLLDGPAPNILLFGGGKPQRK